MPRKTKPSPIFPVSALPFSPGDVLIDGTGEFSKFIPGSTSVYLYESGDEKSSAFVDVSSYHGFGGFDLDFLKGDGLRKGWALVSRVASDLPAESWGFVQFYKGGKYFPVKFHSKETRDMVEARRREDPAYLKEVKGGRIRGQLSSRILVNPG